LSGAAIIGIGSTDSRFAAYDRFERTTRTIYGPEVKKLTRSLENPGTIYFLAKIPTVVAKGVQVFLKGRGYLVHVTCPIDQFPDVDHLILPGGTCWSRLFHFSQRIWEGEHCTKNEDCNSRRDYQ
jgi:hypothetical protein